VLFHAGTSLSSSGQLVNQGGRVMAITGWGDNLKESMNNAYSIVEKISWENAYFRRDIGKDLVSFRK
jgi:phosphoribosylamine--glycine ligase